MSRLTSDEALRKLMEGNERFVAGNLTAAQQNLDALRQRTATGQQPFACVLACADSRVPVEMIFDQGIGDVFVTRVAGNFITPEVLGTIEYAAALLGTSVIMVLGHASCGAVTAAMQGKSVPGSIGTLLSPIAPAVKLAGGDLATAIKENARIQSENMVRESSLLADLVQDRKLQIVAGYYDLATGRVSLLDGRS